MTEAPVRFTAGALTEIKRLLNEPGFDQSNWLRVGVKGGGCSGLSYVLGFDQKTANDNEYDAHDRAADVPDSGYARFVQRIAVTP